MWPICWKAGEAARIRSPIDRVLVDQRPVVDVQRPRLRERRVRDRELADVVQLRGHLELDEPVLGDAELAPDGEREARHAAHVVAHVGLTLEQRLQEHAVGLAGAEQRVVLLGVEALVGDVQCLGGARSLVGQEDAAERRRDLEALAPLAQRLTGVAQKLLGAGRLDAREHTELVAAEPVAACALGQRLGELVCEPAQQRIAGRVAEAVVVELEAVEVVEDEDPLERAPRPPARHRGPRAACAGSRGR